MIAAWIVYASLVGILMAGGASAIEKLLRAHRRPTRYLWAGAMVFSACWPLGHLLWRRAPEPVPIAPIPVSSWIVAMEPLTVSVGPESALRSFDEPILLIWLGSSILLLTLALLVLFRTYRLRRDWTGDRAGGRSVLLSEEWGPAVVGFLRPQIVLPRWCRDMDEQNLALILDHEAEHLRAGDLRLLFLAGILPILFPWSLPIWWQLGRLRIAVEGDCDLRVLRKYPNQTRSYLELLLEVGGRVPRRQVAATMLSEPGETLEKRIRIMTTPSPKNPWPRGFLLAGLGLILVGLACTAPSPDNAEEAEPAYEIEIPPEPPEGPEQGISTADAPEFTPFTVRPELKNREDVILHLEIEYPSDLKAEGIGGTTLVWTFISEEGEVQNTQVSKSSGHESLDDAAVRVAEVAEFSPALNRDKPVPVWISFPITFATSDGGSRIAGMAAGEDDQERLVERGDPAADLPPPPPARGTDADAIADAPTFTPYTVQPSIDNRTEVARALEESYPRDLRDEGIGGTVTVWFLIDETGAVRRTMVDETSGYDRLDAAALEVADIIEFTPALNRDKAVPVWISLPITFTTR